MRTHLQRDLEVLTKKLLAVGSTVEQATTRALTSLIERQLEMAREVRAGDAEVDELEVEVEEDCLKILALHAPVAADLRIVIAYLKLNNDLERVGDLARNIAERAEFLSTREPIEIPEQIPVMGNFVRTMLRECLDAVVNADTALARKVLDDDEKVDLLHKQVYGVIARRISEEPDRGEELLQLLSVSRYLERMADQATNVAEDVVFMVEGEVIRHRSG
ncbi:MAG TPA: phosphate signaling complex protein PhoU [Thermoanaerobaculia bacterium]|nr:phosphate signaling complex protein PhoU [Thermoanaerobaculia bacterium]